MITFEPPLEDVTFALIRATFLKIWFYISIIQRNMKNILKLNTTRKFISIYMFHQISNACTKYHFILCSICLSLSPIYNSNKLLYYHIHIKLNLKSHSFLNFLFIYVVLRQHSKQPLLRLLLSPFKSSFAKISLAVFYLDFFFHFYI